MVKKIEVEGYASFNETIEDLTEKKGSDESTADNPKRIFVLFSGARNEDGSSWCSDCQKAEPVIAEALSKLNEKDVFIHVQVGQRSFWKDPKCVFRTDNKLRLTAIPTLLVWGTQQRLEEDECADESLLEMLFNECA